MEAIKKWGFAVAVGAFAIFVFGSIGATLASDSPDVPGSKEKKNALREVTSEGREDVREALPPRGLVSGHGIVEPADREVKLGAQAAGVIAKVEVKEGDEVEAGAVLVRLDSEAEAAEVAAKQADLDRAREKSRLSSSISARIEKLAKSGASTTDEQDRAIAEASIDRAAARQADAQLAQAKARLDRLTIKAPAKGTVLQVMVREGEYYSPASGAVAVMGDLSKIRVRMDVDERQISVVKPGQSGYVTAKAFGDRKFTGKVVEVGKRMGRKNLRTDEPTERIDTKILEVVLELDDGKDLVQGLRVVGFLEPAAGT